MPNVVVRQKNSIFLKKLAIASIENVFVYSDRYGHSDLKSDRCQSGILGQFKMAAKNQRWPLKTRKIG